MLDPGIFGGRANWKNWEKQDWVAFMSQPYWVEIKVEVENEAEVDLRLRFKWGWDEVESNFNWNWVKSMLSLFNIKSRKKLGFHRIKVMVENIF